MAKLLAVFCTALFSCLAITSAPARAAVPNQPPHFTVRLLTANGSGCPAGTTAVSAVSDTAFTVTYSQYTADAGNGASPGDFRKNCQLDVRVGVPAGWTFGVASEQYRGYALLGTGARGTLSAHYYIPGVPGTFGKDSSLYGPMDNDFEFDDHQFVVAWAPCHFNAGLNINTALRVYQGTDPSFFNELTMDSTDVRISTTFHLVFEQCS